jgi:RNA polymerase sigma-70 factor (ECF subfamily)
VNYSTFDDATLLGLIARSHADALSELYDRYSRLVFSLAVGLVGDHATAEEITLDVFARVWDRAATYRPEQAKVSTWLTSIARYRSIDELRRRGARSESHSVPLAEVSSEAIPWVDSPEQAAELALQQQRVRAALADLPLDQREALGLAYFKGYTHREIAEALGQPLGTVKTRIRLAMQKLRQALLDEQVPVGKSEGR